MELPGAAHYLFQNVPVKALQSNTRLVQFCILCNKNHIFHLDEYEFLTIKLWKPVGGCLFGRINVSLRMAPKGTGRLSLVLFVSSLFVRPSSLIIDSFGCSSEDLSLVSLTSRLSE